MASLLSKLFAAGCRRARTMAPLAEGTLLPRTIEGKGSSAEAIKGSSVANASLARSQLPRRQNGAGLRGGTFGSSFHAATLLLRRSYSARPPVLVDLPLKIVRVTGCKGDQSLTIKEFIHRYPLFRKTMGHPFIPDTSHSWEFSPEGRDFLVQLGVSGYLNAEYGVSIAPSLNEDDMRISSRYSAPQFPSDAKGVLFDETHTKGSMYVAIGTFVRGIVKKYYPKAKLPPEFHDYIQRLRTARDNPSSDEEEAMIFNAALLSPESAKTYIYRGDGWLRKEAREEPESKDILIAYGKAKTGAKGETISYLISQDKLFGLSETVGQQKFQLLNQGQQQGTKGPIKVGSMALASQRDLYMHVFDKDFKEHPAVVAAQLGKYDSSHVAEYTRWMLRTGNTSLQKFFLQNNRHPKLGMRSLFPCDWIGHRSDP